MNCTECGLQRGQIRARGVRSDPRATCGNAPAAPARAWPLASGRLRDVKGLRVHNVRLRRCRRRGPGKLQRGLLGIISRADNPLTFAEIRGDAKPPASLECSVRRALKGLIDGVPLSRSAEAVGAIRSVIASTP